MLWKSRWIRLPAVLALCAAFSCVEYGKVDQGRVVSFDKENRTVTLIRDKQIDTLNPDYSYLPALTYRLPDLAAETGPDPKAGGRMKLDTAGKQIVIYDPGVRNFRTIDIRVVDLMENVDRTNPLVDRTFPVVDREKKTVTVYSGRQKVLCTLELPEEYLSYPDATWDAGDEVRIYYKEEGKALRFMNISRTDIFKK